MNLPHFDGEAYDPQKDHKRLTTRLDTIRDYMLSPPILWYSLRMLASDLNYPEASISAQLRNLRKPRFGGYTVSRKRLNGTFYYRVEPKK